MNRANRYRKNKKKNIFSSLFGRKKSDKVKNKINHADSGQKRTRQINAVDDPRNPLWKKNPDKYAPQKPLWQRFFIKLGSIFLFWFLIFGVVAVLVGGVAATIIYSYTDPELAEKLADQDLNMSSTIYVLDKLGNYVEYETLYSKEHRSWTNSEDMPKHLKEATVAIEDKRFYSHLGVDPIRTAKATIDYGLSKILGRSTANLAGGSTLTQQLVKNVTGDKENDPMRKVEEMLRALYLERNYSKEQILEFYLNTVYFNNNCYGIGTAAEYYFDKEVWDLTVVESAAIIAITKSPEYYDPYRNPDNNKSRRNLVLYEMKEQGYISEDEYQQYKEQDLDLRDRSLTDTKTNGGDVWSYATDTVFEAVVADLRKEFNLTRTEAVNKMYTGGLKIYTTIDLEIQQIMDEFFADENNYNNETYTDRETGETYKPQVAMEVMDPQTGNILGVIGGRGEKQKSLELNRATQSLRQPGSAIKPLSVYGYALENNIVTPGSAIDDFPTDIFSGKAWPVNYDGTYNGLIDVYKALSYSYNTPSVRVLDMITVQTSYNFAKTMLGLNSLVDEDMQRAPLSVGSLTYGLTVQEMTAAYTAYANGGVYTNPRCYTRVENYKGDVILDNTVDRKIVYSPQTAYLMTNILSNVLKISNNGRAAVVSGVETVGKTGTTSNFYDRWFVGYTPYYLGGIWWGYDDNYPTSSSTAYQTRLWGKVMNLIHKAKGYTSGKFEIPEGIVKASYCTCSGMAPGPYCSSDPRGSQVKSGYFKEGTQPTEQCNVHHVLYVCTESGQIAHENCPHAKQRVFVDYVRRFGMRVRVKDAEYLCPRLSSNLVLYQDSVLPVYMNMLSAGEYPGIPRTSKTRYANTLCTVHTPSSSPHIYSPSGGGGGSGTGNGDDNNVPNPDDNEEPNVPDVPDNPTPDNPDNGNQDNPDNPGDGGNSGEGGNGGDE